jgi:hypothetical protein
MSLFSLYSNGATCCLGKYEFLRYYCKLGEEARFFIMEIRRNICPNTTWGNNSRVKCSVARLTSKRCYK